MKLLEHICATEQALTDMYAPLLNINPDLNRKLVSFQASKNEPIQRWFRYKEGFSTALMEYIFDRVGISSGRILDPFAGSGTALFAASDRGIDATGIELLPSSIESIAVRMLLRTSNHSAIASAIRAFSEKQPWNRLGLRERFPHVRITTGAFPEETEASLERYLYETSQVIGSLVSCVLRFAAMCVLESISYTRKDGQYLRWDYRSSRSVGGKPFNKGTIYGFDEAIREKLVEIATDLDGLEREPHLGQMTLLSGSCLDILPTLADASYDGLVTSPPYCNRYDYTRTYALELAMMGTGEEDLRNLRQTMLSCTVENREKAQLHDRAMYGAAMGAFASHETLRCILDYLEECRENGTLNNNGIPRMVRNYFVEMALVIFECARILKPGAPLVMVNDNVRYQGVHIPVDLILSEFAKQAGFDIEAIWVLPRGKGNSSQQMGAHGREEVRKCVYIWRKKKGT